MSKAFIYKIKSNSTFDGTHQCAPACMLTFIRWSNRDTLRMQAEDSARDLSVREPLIVINDCISVTTSHTKSNLTPSMSALLRAGDVNYETSIAPGDFVFVNMVETEEAISDLFKRATNGQPINEINDGFKGLYKVQSVRRVISIDPATGIRAVMFQIDGYAFTEFNNSIYFNPYLLDEPEFKKTAIFVANIGLNYKKLVESGKGFVNVQDILMFLIENFLGAGVPADRRVQGVELNFNTLFYVPQLVGRLLGQNNAKAAKDLYIYLMGIQRYGSGEQEYASTVGEKNGDAKNQVSTVAAGMQPINIRPTRSRFYSTGIPCEGTVVLNPEYWNQIPVWSILKQYINDPINELFTCFRISPSGRVMPTVVMRQIPFSTESYSSGPATKFLNLPRWKIDSKIIYDVNIGRDEAARINFVQIFGLSGNSERPEQAMNFQIRKKNYVADTADIKRSGLRPYIRTSHFDFPRAGSIDSIRAPVWAKLIGDALIGGHLKLNGTIVTSGIEAPIAVGDNLELDGVVYHIESVMHNMSITPSGKKQFKTTIQLSNGIDKDWTATQPRYAEMENTDIKFEREKQWDNEQLFVGWTDEQYRPDREGPVKFDFRNNPFTLPRRKTSNNQSSDKVIRKSKKDKK